MRRGRLLLVALLAVLASAPALAQAPARPPKASAAARPSSYALFRLDALGLAPEIVEQLERILRVELSRAIGAALPSAATVNAVILKNAAFQGCTGDPACLGPIARALGADRIVAGNVGGLGDSFVVNLKLVSKAGVEQGRATATLHGNPDELIQEVRLATYRLVAPAKLTGAISLLSEVPGASVRVDDRPVGITPLPKPIDGLPIGEHTLRVARAGYADFVDRVPVRFEKATEVVVHQRAVTVEARLEEVERVAPRRAEPPFYSRWWFWLGAGAVGAGVGVGIGALLVPKQSSVACSASAGCP